MRPLKIGIGLAVAGVAMLVSGGVLLNVAQAVAVIEGSKAEVGNAIEFEAEDVTYTLVLVRADRYNAEAMDRAVTAITCTVQFADGTSATVDGSSQFSADSTDAASSIGTFDAVAGPATVVCSSSRPSELIANIYALAKERTALLYTSYGLMAAGLLAAGIAVWLIIIGARGRTVFET
ncbi:MAG: hypothetical protein M9961_18970 [Ilumatobacteraceae bacterium]|nr:hypothetical protein [Ilumatobacteraceae bacterium]